MTERERFIRALKRQPIEGHCPTFELVFFLTLEAIGRIHPSHLRYDQWKQMSAREQQLQLDYQADTYIETAEKYHHSAIFVHPVPDDLENTVRLHRPYYKMDKKTARETLQKLKQMAPLLDRAEGSSSKWKTLKKSIDSIDLDDPNASGEKKLQEILDNTCGYMKGRKKLRGNELERQQFDQSLDILAVLAEGSEYAKYQAETVVDRINEVRTKADKDYDPISLSEYGALKLSEHTNSLDMKQINAYDQIATKSAYRRPEEEKLVRYGADKMPQDPSRLVPWPKKSKAHPEGYLSTIRMYKEFASGQKRNKEQVKGDLATLLAVADSQIYYKPARKTGESEIVCNQKEVTSKNIKYLTDPVVDKMAEEYAEHPEKRLALTSMLPTENGEPRTERSGDVKTLNLGQLKKEYDAMKKSMELQPGL